MGRVAIVTGGTRGIGEAISVALKEAGHKVAATYAGNDEAAERFRKHTGVATYKFDVSDFEACKAAVEQIEKDLGPVDILVNNAGITRDGTMHRMSFDQWNAVLQTNLSSCFNMCRCVIEGMRERNFGRIVNIGSVNGQAGQYGQVNYAAAKSGIHGFTKALAKEGAAKGITVNAIAPGAGEGAGEDRGDHPGRPSGPGARHRAWRDVPGRRRRHLHHRFHHRHQRRPAHVLSGAAAAAPRGGVVERPAAPSRPCAGAQSAGSLSRIDGRLLQASNQPASFGRLSRHGSWPKRKSR